VQCLILSSAYELYADPESDGQVGDISMAERFKSTFSHKDVKVHFVGAWYMILSLLVRIS